MTRALLDSEFGSITVRRSRLSLSVRLKIDDRGTISISMPRLAPLYLAKKLLNDNREQVRRSLQQAQTRSTPLLHGDLIGKSHRLVIRQGEQLGSRLVGTTLQITLPARIAQHEPQAQTFIKQAALKALRTQAKAFLTRRLTGLADQHGFAFTTIRFSNAGTRWGSCSSGGTISLNIWLMQLPFELIDYVLIHELCHTRHMNHSPQFWGLVEGYLPNYRDLKRALKARQPYL